MRECLHASLEVYRRPCCSSLLLSAGVNLCALRLRIGSFSIYVGQSTGIGRRVHEIQVSSMPGESSTSRQKSKRPPKQMLQWLPGQSLTAINVRNDDDLAETQLTSGMAAIRYSHDSNSNVSACPRKQQDSCTDTERNPNDTT